MSSGQEVHRLFNSNSGVQDGVSRVVCTQQLVHQVHAQREHEAHQLHTIRKRICIIVIIKGWILFHEIKENHDIFVLTLRTMYVVTAAQIMMTTADKS